MLFEHRAGGGGARTRGGAQIIINSAGTLAAARDHQRQHFSWANLLVNGTKGLAVTHHLLSTTNLNLPLSQWASVGTNTSSAGGSFSFTATNAINPGAWQQFYMLQVP